MMMRLRHHPPFAVILSCVAIACSERPSPVAPIATPLAVRNGGAPQPVDPTPFTDPGLSAICGFPVQLAFGGKSKPLVLPGDRIAVIGGGSITLTNLSSGRSERLVVSGIFQRTTLPNGNFEDVLIGQTVVAFDNSFVHPFANSLILATGRFSVVVDPTTGAFVEPFQGNGTIVDLCDVLSSPV
jgi:hypothetical protein